MSGASEDRGCTDIERLLRASARVSGDDRDDLRLRRTAERIRDWSAVPASAERHGLAPLLRAHLRRASVSTPTGVDRALTALTARHRRANTIRCGVLREILDAFERAGIRAAVLKGAALASLLYPSIELRPMSDIDLLVDPCEAVEAQRLLARLGFDAQVAATSARLVSHHHLPAATRNDEGLTVSVEIHRDAFARDAPGSLTLRRCARDLRAFDLGGRPARTLGHEHMLHHLCRHAAERASILKLIWVADIAGYAQRFESEIDWERLQRHCAFVVTALGQLGFVTPLPGSVERHVPPAAARPPGGVGVPCVPLSAAIRRGRPVRAIAADVLSPSEWWLRLHYGVPSSKTLVWHRLVVHPFNVARWLTRRAATFAAWHAGWARG